MTKYLVGISASDFEEREFLIVNAPDAQTAITAYLSHVVPHDNTFAENVYGKSTNASFAEHFWIVGEEETDSFMRTGTPSIDEDTFEKRARQFFGERIDDANRYLAHYYSDDDTPSEENRFPVAMLVFMWQATNYAPVTAVPFDEIEEI